MTFAEFILKEVPLNTKDLFFLINYLMWHLNIFIVKKDIILIAEYA